VGRLEATPGTGTRLQLTIALANAVVHLNSEVVWQNSFLTRSEESRMGSELATLLSLGKGAVVASVLELDVSGAGAPGTYRVEVLQSPGGEAAATLQLRPVEMLDRLPGVQQAPLASSVPSRGPLSRGQTSVRTVGRRLFLGINDGGPENNRGSWDATVAVDPRGG